VKSILGWAEVILGGVIGLCAIPMWLFAIFFAGIGAMFASVGNALNKRSDILLSPRRRL
jgi:hypothetical protein